MKTDATEKLYSHEIGFWNSKYNTNYKSFAEALKVEFSDILFTRLDNSFYSAFYFLRTSLISCGVY